MTTLEKKLLTRSEVAEMLGVKKKTVAALCSPSKRTLIVQSDNPDIIDISIEKNRKYIKNRITDQQLGIDRPKVGVSKRQMADDRRGIKPKPKIKSTKVFKKQVQEGVPDKADEVVEAPYVETIYDVMDKAKKDKMIAEAELKQLEVKQKMGDLVSASAIIPFIKKLTSSRDESLKTETISLIKDLIVEFSLESSFIGRFERDFIDIMNKTTNKAINDFKEGIDE